MNSGINYLPLHSIIFDHNKFFTSNFWEELQYLLDIHIKMSITVHSELDKTLELLHKIAISFSNYVN